MSDYPEHDKLTKIKDQSQSIGEFIDWLYVDQGVALIRMGSGMHVGELELVDLLAKFFGIDQRKLEAEKRDMLESIRSAP